MSDLVGRAQEAIELAREYADTEELDKAYVQYLRASEITINIIPHHPDYRVTVSQSPAWYKQFASLMMVWFSSHERAVHCFLSEHAHEVGIPEE